MFLQSSKSKSKIIAAATHADEEYKLYRIRLNLISNSPSLEYC